MFYCLYNNSGRILQLCPDLADQIQADANLGVPYFVSEIDDTVEANWPLITAMKNSSKVKGKVNSVGPDVEKFYINTTTGNPVKRDGWKENIDAP